MLKLFRINKNNEINLNNVTIYQIYAYLCSVGNANGLRNTEKKTLK